MSLLQEEHKIFKRPFIINGMDYIEKLKQELGEQTDKFETKYFGGGDTLPSNMT